ncbi:RDD family protein [Staphylococcus pseudintermedius]|uniref:RDD family protein n=1 Tax=Staphylococcus pseudintermedius TaxID=283734 RepID=A0A8H9BX77_STAPS|nr:RDD family protein [Staphylococcus pseudintermedius]ADX76360.1 RDD family protein [Staphylococcus pseudintermedius ED99]EGQ0311471.1 RDD family protein [Staphylococcus pseudintermedius]EGQ0317965.1 RDD family protein [Staphylococcus pseudintermedius]EGQ0359556.1 RDD family protein [Staphylococcus pseudintermedius]EGQ0383088.1 RDD family protein [Staphylococcus pseudintermedius]
MQHSNEFNYNPSQPRPEMSRPMNSHRAEGLATQTIEKHRYELDAFFYAGFGRRFLSYIIDLAILWGVTQIVLNPIYGLTGIDSWKLWIDKFSLGHMLDVLIYFSYFVLMTKYFQQTVGKMIVGIKVYHRKLTRLNWSDVLMREWIGRIISNVFFGLPYLAVLFTPKHIGVHDYFADTVVVKNKYLHYIKETEGI